MLKHRTPLFLVVGFVLLLSCARRPDVLSSPSHFADLHVDEISSRIATLEEELRSSQAPRSVQMHLALMYALSSRLDPALSSEQRKEQAAKSVQIVENLRKRRLQAAPDDADSDLLLGFLLAQVHATLDQESEAWKVLSAMEEQYTSDPARLERVRTAGRLLKEALKNGYPHSALLGGGGN